MEGRCFAIVLCACIGPGGQKGLGGRSLAGSRGTVQRCFPIIVASPCFGSGLQQERDALNTPEGICRPVQRR